MDTIFETIESKLHEIDSIDYGKPRKRIVILGAGMAGLVSAYELSKLGHEVTIYEASNRVGGRVWTKRFADGQYHEFGAMRIPEAHDHTRYYAKEICKLDFRRFVNDHDEDDAFYYIKGIKSQHKKALEELIPKLNLTLGEKEIVKRAIANDENLLVLLGTPFASLLEEIKSKSEDLEALFAKGPITSRIQELDQLSLGDFLRRFVNSQDALDLIGAITALEVWWDKAVTMFLRDEISQEPRESNQTGILDEIVGGLDLLPTTLASKLPENVNINYGREVISLEKQQEKIQVVLRNTKDKSDIQSIDCDYVICTIPFAVLRRIKLIGLSEAKNRAIRNLSYASSIKVLLHCRERFWESKYKIIGGGSQTDLINRSIYYPSDNFRPTTVRKMSKTKGLHTSFVRYDREVLDKDVSKGPGVLLGSYSWGADARRLGTLPHKKREEVVKNTIANFHPEIMEKGMVDDSASIFWDEYDWAGGAFCFMNPGDFIRYYEDTIAPEGKLFFAGEHCSLDQGWIQGAIISALRTIKDIVSE
ncbi:NAD(P)/FAD-dependent oxidoreductase [Mastigocoleus sp. MO_188.B34]|uniref:flavin monoamine oxidase family protein n=1 Tax=Mastigocoleus sp. MO_188.B34 TaxID=3036635 RepID=UPI002638A7D6|nr:NAD(P)/FAD-dependent oxidoreductase [Mastigocoleus sp. MO_188.B34]MDJ0697420.1 NAD(P)/FAD-dependent oxidoreductase [Mastigocoleus sp. MO_188.B34]